MNYTYSEPAPPKPKKFPKWILVLIAIIVLGLVYIISIYNSLIIKEETVKKNWSDVETQYQRRFDLIPNLQGIVQGSADNELKIIQEALNSRAKMTQTNINIQNADDLLAFQNTQAQISSSLGRLIAVAEDYPEIKSNESFLKFQDQLEGTENRISVARSRYNDSVKIFNTAIRKFPHNILASRMGLDSYELYEADDKANTAPSINFDSE